MRILTIILLLFISILSFAQGKKDLPVSTPKKEPTTDTIALPQKTRQLKEVKISRNRPVVQRTLEKTIVNVENSSLAVGNTALDILNRLPGVSIAGDGTVQLNGKSGVTIMLDGKLTYLSASQLTTLLKSTNSSQISTVELMLHPSAKYDAAGSAGIINIILKKNKAYGTNGTVTAEAATGKYVKSNSGFSLNKRNEHFNFFGSYNYADNKRYSQLDLDRIVNVPGSNSHIRQQSKSVNHNYNHNYKAGLDYDINQNNTIGFVLNGYTNNQSEAIADHSMISNNLLADQSVIVAENTAKNYYHNLSSNLNYRSVIDTLGQQLNVDLNLLTYHNSEQDLYENNFFDDHNTMIGLPVVFRNSSPVKINIKALKIDYTYPVSKSLKMDFGIKSSTVNTDNDFLFENRLNEIWTKDVSSSNQFLYKETINAAYTTINKSWTAFTLQLGLRAEHTSTEGNSLTIADITGRKYLDLFPAIFLNHKINENQSAGISITRRIDRPTYGSLNPFLYFLDLYTYKTGNPYLTPQYTNSFSISYQLFQKYNLNISYDDTKDVIADVVMPDTFRKALFISPQNLSHQRTVNLNLSIPVIIASFWSMENDLSIYHSAYHSANILGAAYQSSKTAFNGKSSQSFKIDEHTRFEVAGNYQSTQLLGTSYLKSFFYVDMGLSHKLYCDQLSMKLSIKDVFNRQHQTIVSNLPGLTYRMYNKPETRIIALGLNYAFGGKEIKPARRRSAGIDEEKERIKD